MALPRVRQPPISGGHQRRWQGPEENWNLDLERAGTGNDQVRSSTQGGIPEYIRLLRRQMHSDTSQIVVEEVERLGMRLEQQIASHSKRNMAHLQKCMYSLEEHLSSHEVRQWQMLNDLLSGRFTKLTEDLNSQPVASVDETQKQTPSAASDLKADSFASPPEVNGTSGHSGNMDSQGTMPDEQNGKSGHSGSLDAAGTILLEEKRPFGHTITLNTPAPLRRSLSDENYYQQLQTLQEIQSQLYQLKVGTFTGSIVNYYQDGLKNIYQGIAGGWYFDMVCAVVILANIIFVAVESDIMMKDIRNGNLGKRKEFVVLQWIFTSLFLLEYLIRIFIYRSKFFSGPQMRWHVFDTALIICAIVELVLSGISAANSTLALRVLRVFRLFRITRIVRTHVFFRELRMIVYALVQSMRSLLWSLTFLILTVFLFAIAFMQGVANHCIKTPNKTGNVELLFFFGSLDDAMTALLMAVSGGEDWGRIMRALDAISWMYKCMFIMYVLVVMFGVLNVVTGLFVESAMTGSKSDAHFVGQEEKAHRALYVAKMRKLFEKADADYSGTLTWDEFERVCKSETMRGILTTLEIEVTEARHLFLMLDVSFKGEITLDEFLIGCWNLKGQAKALSLAELKWEQKKSFHALDYKFEALQLLLHELFSSPQTAARTICEEGSTNV